MTKDSDPANERWLVLVFCTFAAIYIGTIQSVFSPILPIIRQSLGLTYTGGGLFTTSYFVGYTLSQIPWGFFADRYGGGRAIACSILGLSLFTALTGCSGNEVEIMAWQFLAGLLGGGIFVPGIRTISEWFLSGRRGVATGIFGAGVNIGAILAATLSPHIAAQAGWRWSVWTVSATGVLLSPIIWAILGKPPRRETKAKGGATRQPPPFGQYTFWILGFDQFLRLGTSYALSTWLPTYLHESKGLDLEIAALSITVVSILGIVSNPIGGLVSDRIGETTVLAVSFAAMVPAFITLQSTLEPISLWLAVVSIGWLTNFMRGPIFAILPKLFGVEHAGRATGYQNTFASFGAVVLPFTLGFLRDATASFTLGWLSLAAFCSSGFLATITMHTLDRKKGRLARRLPDNSEGAYR